MRNKTGLSMQPLHVSADRTRHNLTLSSPDPMTKSQRYRRRVA